VRHLAGFERSLHALHLLGDLKVSGDLDIIAGGYSVAGRLIFSTAHLTKYIIGQLRCVPCPIS